MWALPSGHGSLLGVHEDSSWADCDGDDYALDDEDHIRNRHDHRTSDRDQDGCDAHANGYEDLHAAPASRVYGRDILTAQRDPARYLPLARRRLMLAKHAEDYRIEYNEIRPHEAIAWNRPKEVHLGLADATVPTFQTEKVLPTP